MSSGTVAHRRAAWQVVRSVAVAVAVGVALLAGAPAQGAYSGVNGKIAFKLGRHLFTINPDGTGLTQLTFPSEYNGESYPRWSPDGQRIAFSASIGDADTSPSDGLVIANGDGTGQTEITGFSSETFDEAPTWSPDGSKLAFEHLSIPTGGLLSSDIYTINADGSGATKLTNNGTSGSRVTDPAWSPDGSKIAFGGPGGVNVMNADGTSQTVLASGPRGLLDWSPDGSRIAFTSGTDLWVMNSDGSGQRQLATKTRDPAWSPDGQKFAVLSEFNSNPSIYHLYTMNGDGTGATHIPVGGVPLSPDWQPLPTASYEHPGSASSLSASLVPTFRPCGTGANPADGQHSPPLGTQSCLPPTPGSNVARVGSTSTGSASFTVVPGDTDPTNGDQADVTLSASLGDVKTTAGTDYVPNASGPDLTEITRLRLTDKANNYGGASGTATEYDFRVPLDCVATSDPSVGSTCSTSTSADSLLPGFVTEQRQTVVQAFRVRVDDAGANGTTGDSDDRIFATQGVYIP